MTTFASFSATCLAICIGIVVGYLIWPLAPELNGEAGFAGIVLITRYATYVLHMLFAIVSGVVAFVVSMVIARQIISARMPPETTNTECDPSTEATDTLP